MMPHSLGHKPRVRYPLVRVASVPFLIRLIAHVAKWFNYLSIESEPNAGVNPAWWLHHRSLARTVKKNAYLLANEWISANLGWHLRLPIPPFALMRKSGQTTRYFASLDYGKKTVSPTDMNPTRLCECHPHLATGIVVFDILIANPDRHEGNVKVDSKTNPTTVEVFDHDHALFGFWLKLGRGVERLQQVAGKLGFTFFGNTTDVHKIGKELRTAAHFDEWVERVGNIPPAFIEDIVSEALKLDITNDEADFCKQFLIQRQGELREIVKKNKSFFQISDWGLLYQ